MIYTEKSVVEDFIIQELEKLGWQHVRAQEVNQRRNNEFKEPLVAEGLKSALKRLNETLQLTDADLYHVMLSLRGIPANLEGIRRFLDIFRNGLLVPVQEDGRDAVVKLVDLENPNNNEFVVTRQFRVEGVRRGTPDIVLLVNGIPLVLIECKPPTRPDVDWTIAYDQIKRYEEEIPEIFKYVQFSIATDGIKTRYFPNAFNGEGQDAIGIWKDPYPFEREDFQDDLLKIAVHGLLSKSSLLDLIENFIFVKKERDKSSKVMARYMQFRASNRITRRVIDTLGRGEGGKFGLIWHWQGSGKTYAMAFSAWKLLQSPEAENPSIFVMVDRKDLEEQVEKDFSFIEIPIERIGSIKRLLEVLTWGREGKRGIFLVTVEKFRRKEFEQLAKKGVKLEIERENVVVLADEVHRTQYGMFSTLWRSVFKNAFVFGFTGTPLAKFERNTFQKFCPKEELYLDRYSMLDSLRDEFTVQLSYQAKLPEYHLDSEKLEDFTRFEEQEIDTLSEQERRALRRKVRVTRDWARGPKRITRIAENIATHFKDVVEPTGLKAMIVAIDRKACVLYKNALDEILAPSVSEVVMSFEQNPKGIIKDCLDSLRERYETADIKQIHKKVIDSYLRRKEPAILIVTDMLITGFDAPNLWTMYLDKPLREHRLLQAIARTNRRYLSKKFGRIVDYIGVLPELQRAFKMFEAADARDLKLIIRDLSKEREAFNELIAKALKLLEGVKREDTRESLMSAVNVLKLDPEKAKDFETTINRLMKSYEMLQGEPFLRGYLADYKELIKVYLAYGMAVRRIGVDELRIRELSKKTATMIQETIDVGEIDDTFPIVTIDEEYVRALGRAAPTSIGAAIDIVTAVRYEISTHRDSPFFTNLSEEVERTYQEVIAKKIETADAVETLLLISKRIAEWKREEKEIGKDRYPLYEALASASPEVDKERAVSFIGDLVDHLQDRKLLFEGWQLQRPIRRSVRAETRLLLLSGLKDYRDKVDELTEALYGALEELTWAS